MPTRETYVSGFAVLSVVAAAVSFAALSSGGYVTGWTNVLTFLIVAGLGFALPQLYLARTDSSVPPRWRLWFVVAVLVVFGYAASKGAGSGESTAIWLLIGVGLAGALAYEFRAGLREVRGADQA